MPKIEEKKVIEEINVEWKTLKDQFAANEKELKQNGRQTVEMKEKTDRMETKMGDLDKFMEQISAKLNAPGYLTTEDADAKIKAGLQREDDIFFKYLSAHGQISVLNLEEQKTMILADETSLGFLAPGQFDRSIIKDVVEMSPFRALASVRRIRSRQISRPKRTSELQAFWEGETTPAQESKKTHGLIIIPANKLKALSKVSDDSLEDIPLLRQDLRADFSEQFAKKEGAGFINGNSINKPEGVLTNGDIQTITTEDVDILTFDDMINLQTELLDFYWPNATWIFNRRILKVLRKIKDGEGLHLWQPAVTAGIPASILDMPYRSMTDMPETVDNGNDIVVLGDFRRGYKIVDRTGMSVQVLDQNFAVDSTVGFLATKRVGGGVEQPEAMKKLKVKVA